jgi:hypothetical protein
MMSRCAWVEHCVSVELTQDVKAALPIQPMPLATRTAARMRRASCMSGETQGLATTTKEWMDQGRREMPIMKVGTRAWSGRTHYSCKLMWPPKYFICTRSK